MTENWKLRMEHERDWRDAGVEAQCRQTPSEPDGLGYLALAGPLRRSTPDLDRIFRAKGHDSLYFGQCRCSTTHRMRVTSPATPGCPQTQTQTH